MCVFDLLFPNQLKRIVWTPIERHTLIAHNHSPYDKKLKDYFNKRNIKEFDRNNVPYRQKLAKKQHYLCPSFYKSLISLGQYADSNPLIDAQAILNDYKSHAEGKRKDKPRMPSIGGAEAPVTHRRMTDSFFKLINEEWQPHIIYDPHLPYQVYQAEKKQVGRIAELVIARLLFETGARSSEVILLTVGDWRSRKSFQEVNTFNKGCFGRKVKFLRFSKDTVKRLAHYLNTGRKQIDPDHSGLDDLPEDAPLFLTETGAPLNYKSWYKH